MSERLCILVCRNFLPEVEAAIAAEGWQDVTCAAFPSRCGRPVVDWDELRGLLPEDCGQAVALGRACLHTLNTPPDDFPATRIVHLEQCFHLVAGAHLVADAIADGGYLITPAWLRDWRGQLEDMGFRPEQAGEFFRDFARELVLLDTGIDAEAQSRLVALQTEVGLPARRIAVGLDHVRSLLGRVVLEWRLERERRQTDERDRRHARELADYVSAMDLLSRLTKTTSEAEAIAAIEELFRMLFAPHALYYLRVENNLAIPHGAIPAEIEGPLRTLREQYARLPDGDGFLLSIASGESVVGRIAVHRLAFPEYRERYLNMALSMSGVCGLAIENARNRKKLLEAEKMASLGILVAGVAHEIGTPLGVGLTAASTLQRQSRNLAQRFAERSMTQSDLNTYLDLACEETGLLCANMERIGQLVDAFRQVAVVGAPLKKQWFRLLDCLEDVIRSLGDRVPRERIEIRVQCDAELEIEGLQSDWASIFVNLIVNSLRHGFGDGDGHGVIDIRVTADARKLRIVYRDDGKGMAPDTLARIFDPFFSTDLQHGMGLGMHLVYNLVTHRLGGDIQCDSQPGQGARFHIEVPR